MGTSCYTLRVCNLNEKEKKRKIVYTSETSGDIQGVFLLSIYRLGTSYIGDID